MSDHGQVREGHNMAHDDSIYTADVAEDKR